MNSYKSGEHLNGFHRDQYCANLASVPLIEIYQHEFVNPALVDIPVLVHNDFTDCRNINCSSDNKQFIYREIVPPAKKVCIRDQSDCNEYESIEIKPAKYLIAELKCKHRLSDAAVEDIAVMLRQLGHDVPKTAKLILEKSREPLKDKSFFTSVLLNA